MVRAAWRWPRRAPPCCCIARPTRRWPAIPRRSRCGRNSPRRWKRYVAHARSFEPQGAYYLANHRGHLMYVRPDERPFITAEMIRKTSFIGTERELKQRIARAGASGVRAGRVLHPARPGARDRGLGPHPPCLRVKCDSEREGAVRRATPPPLAGGGWGEGSVGGTATAPARPLPPPTPSRKGRGSKRPCCRSC